MTDTVAVPREPTEGHEQPWADLERLAKAALMPMPDKRRRSWFNRQRAFTDAANPAAVLELIAAVRANSVGIGAADEPKPQPASQQGQVTADELAVLPLDLAPRDGTLLRLRVRYAPDGGVWTPLDDAEVSWTVGFNNFDNTGEDRWQFVGWSWSHDHLLEAPGGMVLGWLPFHGETRAALSPQPAPVGEVEPVAWRLEHLILPCVQLTEDRRYAELLRDDRYEGRPTCKVTPLFTTPAGQSTEGLREALEAIIDLCPATCETSAAHSMAEIARQALSTQSL